uniref:NBS-LRR disease resistance protein n=1 Tax=Dasypyrum villosum TaxID=40247 RepID=A0A8K1IBG8_9POAL|nr:NBS-LRR disease resistance protein [Dasypyrum villosum]
MRRRPGSSCSGDSLIHPCGCTFSVHEGCRGRPQNLQDEVLHLQSGLQYLSDTLPAMYNLIDQAEWRSHKHCVAELLPKFSDAVYDAEDILDEFRWYERKVTVEGIASQSPFIDFFNCVIQGSFNKVKDIQKRLENLSSLLEKMGLGEATPRFDKSVRPETSSFPIETIMFGRDQELNQVIQLLVVTEGDSTTKAHSKRKRECRTINSSKRTSATINHVCNEQENGLAVLPIVGIGGVGKTTMAQHIYQQVKRRFEKTIWLSVSDDFDVKRLTKEALQSISGEERTGQLDSLQHALHKTVCQKKLLIVLDDLWDDALKENGQSWKRFCAPLKNVSKGSMMLVTTRSQKVADGVRTMETLKLNGLKDDVLWNFFKPCMFGSERFSNDHELEQIGRSILPKLKGSPLAAKTLGRLLRMNGHTAYWNNVLESELWELRQQEDDILPALRLSYMYLPFHLKRCFSFCGVYPKGHEFGKDYLAEIWVAEGFVEPQGDIPIQDIASQYFEDLASRSFFQKVHGAYVIHDLLHDMVQMVSKNDCFILKNVNDFQKIPKNVRHLSVLSNPKFDYSKLFSLCKHEKLRTLICNMPLEDKVVAPVMDHWCTELGRMRVIICASTAGLPGSICHLKHLRYLEISRASPLKSLPSTFYSLYNLQVLYIGECKIESLPSDFDKLISLRRIELCGFRYYLEYQLNCDALEAKQKKRYVHGLKLSSLEHFLHPASIPAIKKIVVKNCARLISVPAERFVEFHCLEELEVVHCRNICSQSLVAPSLKRLVLGYSGNLADNIECCSLTSFFLYYSRHTSIHLQHLPALMSLSIARCESLTSVRPAIFTNFSHCGCSANSITSFLSLTVLTISGCTKLPTLDGLLTQECLPVVERIYIAHCDELLSLPGDRLGSFLCLKDLEIYDCQRLDWQRGLVLPSTLQRLALGQCGDISAWVPSCLQNLASLISLEISECPGITSIPGDIWRTDLASLEELYITDCPDLVSIGGWEAVAQLGTLHVSGCPKMMDMEQPLKRGGD